MPPPPDHARSLAVEVAAAARLPGAARTLLLDLDGTLAPLARRPDAATVPAVTLHALARLLRHGWRVAIVSGRPARQVRAMVPLPAAVVFGSHGAEGAWPGVPPHTVAADVRRRIRTLRRHAQEIAEYPGVLVERKPFGVALHHRGVAAARLRSWRRLREAWLERQDLRGLERIDGKCVVELRPRGADKGRPALTLGRRRNAPLPDRSLVAVGDDVTDEDLFRALRGRGLAVRVGRTVRRTAAGERLPSPAAVRRFLIQLLDLVARDAA